jgi:hypothetical protein
MTGLDFENVCGLRDGPEGIESDSVTFHPMNRILATQQAARPMEILLIGVRRRIHEDVTGLLDILRLAITHDSTPALHSHHVA